MHTILGELTGPETAGIVAGVVAIMKGAEIGVQRIRHNGNGRSDRPGETPTCVKRAVKLAKAETDIGYLKEAVKTLSDGQRDMHRKLDKVLEAVVKGK